MVDQVYGPTTTNPHGIVVKSPLKGLQLNSSESADN